MAQPQWMPQPQAGADCPKGLEYLTQVNHLIVQQNVELLEMFTQFETQNKYTIANALGQQVYFAAEKSGCCERQYCGNARSFDINIVDNNQQVVLTFSRPLRCGGCCCCGDCRQHVTVHCGEMVIGHVKSDCFCITPSYTILSADMEPVLAVKGPCCTCAWSAKFSVRSLTGQEVGLIQKRWSGLAKEVFTDADNFGITFPMDLDVKFKAALLAALFLIDFEFFESSGNRNSDLAQDVGFSCCDICTMCTEAMI